MTCLALQYYPHYLIHDRIFEKKNEHETCVLIFSTFFFSETVLILRIERDMIKDFYWSFCKTPLLLSVLMKLPFSREIFKQ